MLQRQAVMSPGQGSEALSDLRVFQSVLHSSRGQETRPRCALLPCHAPGVCACARSSLGKALSCTALPEPPTSSGLVTRAGGHLPPTPSSTS